MKQESDIGIVGLGVMGRNFMLNLAGHGFNVAGYDIDPQKVSFKNADQTSRISTTGKIEEFAAMLSKPRAVMLLVPAGHPVDAAIAVLANQLQPGDILIDAGNSFFRDTERRITELASRDILYMGTGISGGEEGARNGPSIMPGGNEKAWERVRPMFEAAATKVNGMPCVSLLGTGSSGHFVKMVHNGIEYALMQLIAETYDLMKRGLGLSDDQLHEVYSEWNKTEVSSYLVGITADIFAVETENGGQRLVNKILDVARQKGTGMWTSQSAMELLVPIPSIDTAVGMRNLSVFKEERRQIGKIFRQDSVHANRNDLLPKLKNALYTGMMMTWAQGMALLSVASEKYDFGLKLEEVSRVWKGGCIIRSAMLNDISDAFSEQPDLSNLLLDKNISRQIITHSPHLREITVYAAESGLPVPSMMASLAYLDAFSSEWLPANLIQAQRDYFGAHTYERVDEKGTFHTDWLNVRVGENIGH